MKYYECLRQDIQDFRRRICFFLIMAAVLFLFSAGVSAYIFLSYTKKLESRVEQLETENDRLRSDAVYLFHKVMEQERESGSSDSQDDFSVGGFHSLQQGVLPDNVMRIDDAAFFESEVSPSPYVAENHVMDAVSSGAVWCDAGIDSSYYAEVVQHYGMVSKQLSSRFESDGWHVLVTRQALHAEGVSSGVVALTDYDASTIYISEYDSYAVLHEMGHYLDYVCGFASQDMPADVYAEGISGFSAMAENGILDTDVHNYATTHEFFAECFGMYVMDPDMLWEYCPGVYQYVEQFLVDGIQN